MNGNEDRIWPAKSTDDGKTWSYLAGNPDPTEATYSLAADYDNPSRLVMSYYGLVFFSSDGGATFRQIHTAQNNDVGVVVGGVFFDGDFIAAGTNDGLLVSTDGGANFTLRTNITGIAAGEGIWSFAGAKQGGTTRFFCLTTVKTDAYVGMANSDYWDKMANVYSLDWGGANPRWVQKTGGMGLDKGTNFPMVVGMAKNNISTVYLAGGSANSTPVILKSTNAGTSWANTFLTDGNENIATGWSGEDGDREWSYGECAMGFTVAPNNPNRVMQVPMEEQVGGNAMFRRPPRTRQAVPSPKAKVTAASASKIPPAGRCNGATRKQCSPVSRIFAASAAPTAAKHGGSVTPATPPTRCTALPAPATERSMPARRTSMTCTKAHGLQIIP
jgi:hypothetical protein